MTGAGIERRFDMTGRVVLVTGGTRGIGLALAEGYVAAGARVVVASRKKEACSRVEALLREQGGEALGVPTHLGDLDALRGLVATTIEEFGRLDVVVNNAANALAQPLDALTPDAWQKSFDVNLRGPVFLVKEALPFLAESPHAAVLNLISAGAFGWSAGISMYSAGKAALVSFTRSMAAEFAPLGIRVNGLSPGPFATDMYANVSPADQERMRGANLQKRVASPDEMVGPALLLTSDAGSFVTGQVLCVDGGLVAH